ncbi:MAG: HU family DNA-binding protein [Planctomycetota bacterium]|jgi:nucleoid DNA-binding protein|nr:HU family DNA-binding protein [Planctomycetota bacterium]
MSITRNRLAAEIAGQIRLPQETVREMLSMTLDGIVGELEKTGRVEWRGFGVFKAKSLPPVKKRNPRTGETVMAPAKKKVVFKVGKLAFERLNKKPGKLEKSASPTERKHRA